MTVARGWSSRPPVLPERPLPPVGGLVVVRDEEWLVEAVAQVSDGWRVRCRGVSDLVRDTTATFFDALDEIVVRDPAAATLVPDESPGYRRTRLFVEAMLRTTPVPLHEPGLTITHRMLLDPLDYQRQAVAQALSLENLRPRLLIADAVGLGKTLEIGMVLAELIRRGRGARLLVVTPRHVLEQMQRELWTRFALPLVRLDSAGLQKVAQELPASRNPFTYYPRVIVSVDTLKSDRYRPHLERQRWDVVVIDESHNVTNDATQNHRLAQTLAPNTEALLLASATPHNGRPESFATLVDLLDPTAVADPTDYALPDIQHLFVRRHRHSPAVEAEVGHHWAERAEPEMLTFAFSAAEEAVVTELWSTWLRPAAGTSPWSGRGAGLFPWTLAKAFLSSPHALHETVRNRRTTLGAGDRAGSDAARREDDALAVLESLAAAARTAPAKLAALGDRLREVGVGPGRATRVVLFAERLATLHWLRDALPDLLGLPAEAFALLHGGLPDQAQQEVVEQFGLADAPVRVLLTGDVASEGVNLHRQCHHLVHVDLPWSLIRIEQRNGRIDRYGQEHAPRIAALLGTSAHDGFTGDVRVLTRLLQKEHLAHRALGDAAGLMRLHSATAEEGAVEQALRDRADLDAVVPDPRAAGDPGAADPSAGDSNLDWDALFADRGQDVPPPPPVAPPPGLFADDLAYLRTALEEVYDDPARPPSEHGGGGVGWKEHADQRVLELAPPADLRRRLRLLPQDYLRERGVLDRMVLATSTDAADRSLAAARRHGSTSQWPDALYLSPQHPVLHWATDRLLGRLQRDEVTVVAGAVDHPLVVVQGVVHNRRGQVVAAALRAVLTPSRGLAVLREDALEVLRDAGIGADAVNPGDLAQRTDLADWAWVVPLAVQQMTQAMAALARERLDVLEPLLAAADARARSWRTAATALADDLPPARRERRLAEVARHAEHATGLAEDMAARRDPLVRPLVVVLPESRLAPAWTGAAR